MRYRFASRKIVKVLSQGARRLAEVQGTTHPRENWTVCTNSFGLRAYTHTGARSREQRVDLVAHAAINGGERGLQAVYESPGSLVDRGGWNACIYVSRTRVDCTLTEYLHA